jgi:signal transduction histidine kinase/CheY-like chemotaxis protein
MITTLSSYLLSSIFMIVILCMLGARSITAISQPLSRRRCMILITATILYVIFDLAFIACHLSSASVNIWQIVAFLFYIVYVLLPFAWHIFVRNFVGNSFSATAKRIELIPLIILLAMVVVNPFTGILWSFDASGMYVRGGLFTIYSYLNFFYYVEPVIDLIFIYALKKQKEERYIFQAIAISCIPLFGAVINNVVIPAGTIFPFQPFCSVVVAMAAFFFIATKDSDALKDSQQQAIQVALDKAEEAGRVKTRFLSDMSHDIRTPMNAIINLTDLALAENDINVVHDYLQKMKISGKFLLGLIDDILDVSRIENGAVTLNKENLTRSEFINTIETVIHPLIESKHLHFHSELNPGEYTISVDKLRFNQIFFNLLSNAVKYTPEGGDVWFEVNNLETEDNRLKIQFVVRDNGIGMSEEFQKDLFKPFAREDTPENHKTQGTGLGLAIVKGLVDAMDGTISVKSELGKGSEFSVVFYVDIVAKDEISEHKKEEADTYDLNGVRVLLVEDNELNTYVAQTILENEGCVVTTAENGKVGLDAFLAATPSSFDVILMDVRMPVMDGMEATKAIRSSDHADAQTIPIIAMTADVFEDERKSVIDSGMSDFLAKPVDTDKLYKLIAKHTGKNK